MMKKKHKAETDLNRGNWKAVVEGTTTLQETTAVTSFSRANENVLQARRFVRTTMTLRSRRKRSADTQRHKNSGCKTKDDAKPTQTFSRNHPTTRRKLRVKRPTRASGNNKKRQATIRLHSNNWKQYIKDGGGQIAERPFVRASNQVLQSRRSVRVLHSASLPNVASCVPATIKKDGKKRVAETRLHSNNWKIVVEHVRSSKNGRFSPAPQSTLRGRRMVKRSSQVPVVASTAAPANHE